MISFFLSWRKIRAVFYLFIFSVFLDDIRRPELLFHSLSTDPGNRERDEKKRGDKGERGE